MAASRNKSPASKPVKCAKLPVFLLTETETSSWVRTASGDRFLCREIEFGELQQSLPHNHQLLKNARSLVVSVDEHCSEEEVRFGVLQQTTDLDVCSFPEALHRADDACAVYYARAETVYIVYIYTPDRVRGQGKGRELVGLLRQIAKAEGAQQLKVTLQACIAHAAPFYRACGFLSSEQCHGLRKKDIGSSDELTLFISERRPVRLSSTNQASSDASSVSSAALSEQPEDHKLDNRDEGAGSRKESKSGGKGGKGKTSGKVQGKCKSMLCKSEQSIEKKQFSVFRKSGQKHSKRKREEEESRETLFEWEEGMCGTAKCSQQWGHVGCHDLERCSGKRNRTQTIRCD